MGTGYTRNDTPNNIADGNVINASDLDGEFDAIQTAFNGSTGHSHDGTTGEGPQIATAGLADNAVTTVKITDANVTTAKIADANVTLAKMAANSIDSDQYVDGSIDTAHIGNLQVTTAKIAADAIDGTKLADDAVDSEHYTDGSIDRVHLAADIVDGTKIADDSIDSEHYVDGSIDTAHIADDAVTSAKLDTNIQIAGTLGVTGETTLTTHLNMGDGDIIKLGDSADLQIYHDGSQSVIDEQGTGYLSIKTSDRFDVKSATGELMIRADANGNVKLNYDNETKFETTATGIDVTGTVTADGLTVESALIYEPTVRIKNTNPDAISAYFVMQKDSASPAVNDVLGTMIFQGDDSAANTTNYGLIEGISSNVTNGAEQGTINIKTAGGGGSLKTRITADGNGDISFYEDTGTTPKFFWDSSAEFLGLGTASPTSNLHVSGGNVGLLVDMQNSAGNHGLRVRSGNNELNDGTELVLDVRSGTSNNPLLNVHAGGNVGIGTASPSGKFQVDGGRSYFSANSDAFALYLRYNTSTAGVFVGSPSTDTFTVSRSGGQEHLRIDSSGNLLVGTTNSIPGAGNTAVGASIYNDGRIFLSKSANTVASFNRNTSDGAIAEFRKDGSTVGSIGAEGGQTYIVTGDTGLKFAPSVDAIIPVNAGGANRDNAIDLGVSSVRFKDLYLSGGVYLGGTGSANYLDDYETGSWTPILSSSGATFSYSYNAGHYVKVGDMISCWARITCNATPTGTTGNALFIAGLPFTIYNQPDLYSADSLGHFISYNIPTGYTNATLQYQQSTATVILNFTGDTTGESTAAASAVSSSTQFRFRLTYRTA